MKQLSRIFSCVQTLSKSKQMFAYKSRCPSGDQWQVVLLRSRYWDCCILTSLSMTWTVGLRAPSAGLQMTPRCVMWSTRCREWMPSRGTLTCSRGWPVQTSWSSIRPSVRSRTCMGAIPSTRTGWAKIDWEQSWEEALGGIGWWEAQHDLSICARSPEGQLYPGLHQKQRGQQVKGGDSAPLLCCGEIPPGVLLPALEPSAQERHGPVGAIPKEGHNNDLRAGTPLLWGKAEGVGLFSLEKRMLWRDLIVAFQ